VMDATQWNYEFVTDSATKCTNLHKAEVMRIRMFPPE
jgi:hypothetical protein